jgi:hypothetical protein
MDASRDTLLSSGVSRLAAAAVLATGFCAAVAAAPSIGPLAPAARPLAAPAAFGEGATALRPFGRGPTIRVDKAYGPDDEDCVLAVTRVEDAHGRVAVTRGVACAP